MSTKKLEDREVIASKTKYSLFNNNYNKHDMKEIINKNNESITYVSAYYNLDKTYKTLNNIINNLDCNSKDYKDLVPIINSLKDDVKKSLKVKDIIQTNINKYGNYVYYCNEFDEKKFKTWLKKFKYNLYKIDSNMSNKDKNIIKNFNQDSLSLNILVVNSEYNEILDNINVDGIIVADKYNILDILASVTTKDKRKKLNKLSKKDLIKKCVDKNISFDDKISKENVIDLLCDTKIIDLNNNVDLIEDLDITKKINNKEIYDMFKYILDRLNQNWFSYYELACMYYKEFKNVNVNIDFKTIDGVSFDENGISIGKWIFEQRKNICEKGIVKLSDEQISLLNKIGIYSYLHDDSKLWRTYYKYAKEYYKYYKNIDIPNDFKTINGRTYSEFGLNLGVWLKKQEQADLDVKKHNKLKKIGLFENEDLIEINKEKEELNARAKDMFDKFMKKNEEQLNVSEDIEILFIEDFEKAS